MPKLLEANVITEMYSVSKRPCLLFELGLASTIRFAAYKVNVTFPTAGNVYTAKAITGGNVSQSLEGQIQRVTINFDNVSKDMASYANNEDFRGKTLVIKRIYLDTVGDVSYYNEVFNGHMERPKFSRNWLTVTATSGKGLDRKILPFAYQRMCPLEFGGTKCNTDGNADLTSLTASGTADSGSTTTLVDDALTEAEDFWNYGEIEVTKGTKTYYRKVKSFTAASDTVTFDVELPVEVDDTCTYVIYKGCDKTLATCSAENNWGPSGDNNLNFKGFLHISKKADAI